MKEYIITWQTILIIKKVVTLFSRKQIKNVTCFEMKYLLMWWLKED